MDVKWHCCSPNNSEFDWEIVVRTPSLNLSQKIEYLLKKNNTIDQNNNFLVDEIYLSKISNQIKTYVLRLGSIKDQFDSVMKIEKYLHKSLNSERKWSNFDNEGDIDGEIIDDHYGFDVSLERINSNNQIYENSDLIDCTHSHEDLYNIVH